MCDGRCLETVRPIKSEEVVEIHLAILIPNIFYSVHQTAKRIPKWDNLEASNILYLFVYYSFFSCATDGNFSCDWCWYCNWKRTIVLWDLLSVLANFTQIHNKNYLLSFLVCLMQSNKIDRLLAPARVCIRQMFHNFS